MNIQWMIRRDMPEVLEIERLCRPGPNGWTEDDFIGVLKQRNAIGMVARFEACGPVTGFMVYELQKTRLRLLNFAVHPQHQRRGVGREMVDRLKQKLSDQRRSQIDAHTCETNLPAQLFFKAMGFRCLSVIRGFYDVSGDDAFWFRYSLREPAGDVPVFRGQNRISAYLDEPAGVEGEFE